MSITRNPKVRFPLLLAAAAAVSGCGSNGNQNQTIVRSLNAFIPANGVLGTLGFNQGTNSLSGSLGVAFGQFANGGGYAAVSGGTFNPSATGTATTTPIVFLSPPTIPGTGAAYTLVAAGQSGQTGALAPQLFLVPNLLAGQLVIPAGSIAVRVVNFSLNPNPIGLYATSNGIPTTPLAPGVASIPYGYSSGTNGYVILPSTTSVTMALVDATNTSEALSLSSTSNFNNVLLPAGQAFTVFVYGQPGNGGHPLGATWVVDFPAQ